MAYDNSIWVRSIHGKPFKRCGLQFGKDFVEVKAAILNKPFASPPTAANMARSQKGGLTIGRLLANDPDLFVSKLDPALVTLQGHEFDVDPVEAPKPSKADDKSKPAQQQAK